MGWIGSEILGKEHIQGENLLEQWFSNFSSGAAPLLYNAPYFIILGNERPVFVEVEEHLKLCLFNFILLARV